MHLADLMEKSEGGQFLILSHLQQHSPSSLSEVMAETDFSKATLNKYLSLINDKAQENQLALSIELEDEHLRLLVGADTKGRDIRRAFLDNSIKYQLLIYLLYHGQFQAQQLAQELLISEATLGRHISGLNKLLTEFSISIQNGRLKGPEHKIRYFYFGLLRKVWASADWKQELAKKERQTEIETLEELCGAQLSQGQRLDLVLWSHITQQRLKVNACQFQEIEQKMKGYTDNIFYQRLFRRVDQLFSGKHIALSHDDGEMLVLFAFLVTHWILPLHTMEYILGFGGEIGNLTTQLIQEMKTQKLLGDYIEGPVTYELSQICGQVYLFTGYLLQDKYKYQLENHNYIAENSGRQIKIGLDLTVGYLGYTRMTEVLKRYLEYNRFITIEAFDPATDYDLFVTNNPISFTERIPVYYLKYDLDLIDLANIRQMIYGETIT